MAKTTHQYAVRLSVDGGGRVQAELRGVGDSGDRSLRKIDRASGVASRGLGSLAERASTLRSGVRLLGGALAGIATVGGLSALINRSLEAADAIGKTADKLGIGVEALQELRYAASLAGVEQNTLDMALQRFTRRVGEAARGTGEAKEALASMGIALRDQDGHIRRSEDLLDDVAEALRAVEDPAERLRLAFKLFDSEGVAMVNMLNRGADGLADMRQRARDLGIVLEEDLIRNAEKAKDELDTLGKVISANLTRAVLDLSPLIADLSSGLAELAADAGVAYEQLKLVFQGDFNFEGLSLRSTRRIVEERRQELQEIARELNVIGDVSFLDDPIAWGRKVALERRLQERVEQYRQWAAKLAWMQAEAERNTPPAVASDAGTTPDAIQGDIASAEERARRIARIEQDLQRQLFEARHEGAERIRAEFERLVAEMQGLITPDGSNLDRIEQIMTDAAALRDARLAELARREEEAAARQLQARQRVIEGLRAERDELAMTDRERFVSQALRRLSADATDAERARVRELASALFDERQAIEARNKAEQETIKLKEKGKALTDSLRTAQQAYADEIRELGALLEAGAISQETFTAASEEAYDRMLRASRDWSAGVQRAIRDYLDQAGDAARQFEQATTRALQASEDAFVEWATTGKLSAADLFNSIAEEALRAAWRMAVIKPLGGLFESIFADLGGSIFGGMFGGSGTTGPVGDFPAPGPVMVAHGGGIIGADALPRRMVPAAAFDRAPRFHGGGIVASEVPIIARRGEGVFTPEQMRALAPATGERPVVNVAVNVRNTAPGTEATADWRRDGNGNLTLDIMIEQVEGRIARNVGRGEGIAPTLERRYGLNPAAGAYR